MDPFWKYTGIITWSLLVLWLLLRLFLGKTWLLKLGANVLVRPGLLSAIKKLYRELPDKVQKDTLAEVSFHIIKRLTAIGIIGLLVAVLPIWLLMQQNGLLRSQNEKFDLQNDRINLQNNLLEADRRSSLIFLMSNVLDKVDDEIKEQRDDLRRKLGNVPDSVKYSLSKPLISRIVALSRSFRPYRMMEGDSLSELVSPERGQLFISLMGSNLDSTTQIMLTEEGNFSYGVLKDVNLVGNCLNSADLRWSDLSWSDLSNTNLSEANLFKAKLERTILHKTNLTWVTLDSANLINADLKDAYLYQTNLFGANLSGAKFIGTRLEKTNFERANLRSVDFRWADFKGVINLAKAQLLETRSLFGSRNLDPDLEAALKKEKPCLFTKEGCR